MKIVALVPMKLKNQRLANKNIKDLGGRPLCQYVLDSLMSVDSINEIYVYCSNENIQEYLQEGIKYLKRDENLDLDSTKINEVLSSFAQDVDADIYVLAHTTAPFLKAKSISKVLEAVQSGVYDSGLSVLENREFFWKDGHPFNYNLDDIPRTQDLEVLYSETSGVYVYKKELIKEHNRRIGFKPYLLGVSKIEAIDIDEEIDFQIAKAVLESGLVEG